MDIYENVDRFIKFCDELQSRNLTVNCNGGPTVLDYDDINRDGRLPMVKLEHTPQRTWIKVTWINEPGLASTVGDIERIRRYLCTATPCKSPQEVNKNIVVRRMIEFEVKFHSLRTQVSSVPGMNLDNVDTLGTVLDSMLTVYKTKR